ncbi:RagB/SusD family nutrient uptake outer membrane protein [Gramella sp. AN32]|uniref:RagB/SusD family nutrient uptake outer membrane protein n=1 Tax=Christiangramia antarctica TaxID=2058158 RepID=A0ABW5X2I6_9FLAO|nr:RagB/SusD family nutrient uptake outer membrane protein [Gramella sp. AN32]MCM4157046.1 hypothetical protein [Gramella sp. AN32]
MKNKFLIIIIFSALFTQSCDDKLDIPPEDGIGSATLYKNEAGALAGLMGIYSRIFRAYRQTDFNAMYPLSGTDEGFENRNGTRTFLENAHTSSERFILESWSLLYAGVNAANIMLVELENSPIPEDRKKVFVAEARYLRAYLFMDLERAFGGKKGIPMPLENTLKELLPRTSGEDVYTQIIADLEFAEENLPTIQEVTPGRASKSAAQGLLARANLYRAGEPFTNDGDYYTQARNWAKKVIDGGYHELNPDYSDIFKNLAVEQYDTKEVLMQIAFYYGNQDNQQGGKIGSSVGMRIDNSQCSRRGYSLISSSITLIDAYREDPSDERGVWNASPYFIPSDTCDFKLSSNQFRYGCSKYRSYLTEQGAGSWGPYHWPVLRYSDVLLMFAEAENQLNPGSTEALAAVNQVRNRANATPLENIDLELIQEERRLELCYEGLRKYDLVRWGIMEETVNETLAAHLAQDETINEDWERFQGEGPAPTNSLESYYLDVYRNYDSSKHNLLPIPEQEIGANSLIEQNPNW